MKLLLITIIFISTTISTIAQDYEYKILNDIPYYSDSIIQSDTYIKERCVLDVYYPKNKDNFATVVWFHGGGLKAGNKEIPDYLKEKGLCVIAVNYRLYPKVKAPKYIEDAAAAVSWTFNNINALGGDSTLIFISGHSAGGYLASMIGLDKSWLKNHHIDANNIAGLIPFSGHAITHFTIREEMGISGNQPIIDHYAPLFHVRSDCPPLVLITGDRELELLGRYEENAYLMRMMKNIGHKKTTLYELEGYDHGMTYPAFPLLLKEVERIQLEKSNNKD